MAIITLTEVKTFLQITNTDSDALITALIPEVEAYVKRYTNNEMIDGEGADSYPLGIKKPVSELIRYELNERAKQSGKTSESLGSWSASYAVSNDSQGYPDNVIGLLKPFRKIKFY
jgi:hypothetical protein